MKNFILFCLVLLGFSPKMAAQTYCLQYNVLSITATNVVVKVSAYRGTAFNLGDANVALNFNSNALSNPTLVSTTLNGNYSPTTVTNPATGLASVNIDFNGTTGQGIPIGTTATEVAQIQFAITNSSLTTSFSINSTYCVVYDDAINLLTIGSGCPQLDVTLPLEWLDFQARAVTEKGVKSVHLDWLTGSEINVQHFIVERSKNGKVFEKMGNPVSPNNKTNKSLYHVLDPRPLSGVSFYRIREVSFSGKESFSVIKSVIFSDEKTMFSLHPNPKAKESPLSIQTNWTENYTFNLYDATGKLVFTRLCKGSVELEKLNLTTGFYLYECTTPQDKITGKLVISN